MKIGIVNTYQSRGGAARAAERLHKALNRAGSDSTMFVVVGDKNDPTVRTLDRSRDLGSRIFSHVNQRRAALLRRRYLSAAGDPNEPLRPDWFVGYRELPHALRGLDIVNLNWIAQFADTSTVSSIADKIAPVVWTMHDMLPITGACHYDSGCGRYEFGCGTCPKLRSRFVHDVTARSWRRKQRNLARVASGRLHVVTPSHWLAGCVRRSPIFDGVDVSVIPYAIDTDVFSPRDKAAARLSLGIPQSAKVVLFMAHALANLRKGGDVLMAALHHPDLASIKDMLLLLVGIGDAKLSMPIPCRHLGEINDDSNLSKIYAAADVVALPSRQDNLPNTMIEALACGRPVVGTAVGGIPDMVKNDQTGILVQPGDVAGFREALLVLLGDEHKRTLMERRCHEFALRECDPGVQARRYLDLFRSVALPSRPRPQEEAALHAGPCTG